MDKYEIEQTLISIGMPTSIKGFTYIIDVMVILDMPEYYSNIKWTSIYSLIASMHNVSVKSVERNIRYALETTRNRNNDYDKIQAYLGFDNCENSNTLTKLHRVLHDITENLEIFISQTQRYKLQCT